MEPESPSLCSPSPEAQRGRLLAQWRDPVQTGCQGASEVVTGVGFRGNRLGTVGNQEHRSPAFTGVLWVKGRDVAYSLDEYSSKPCLP